jgi:hypothetical protein
VDAALDGHRRYLRALREAAEHSPQAHRHQLVVLEREIALAADAADSAAYLAASGDLLELSRAPALDRLANRARVSVAAGDPWRAEAAAVEYQHLAEAVRPEEWPAAAAAGEPARARGGNARGAYNALVHALIRLHSTADEVERADALLQAETTRDTLLEADPGFEADAPSYALRTPWTGDGLAVVHGWLAELGVRGEPVERGDPLEEIERAATGWEQQPRAPVEAYEPPIADVVAPYRAALEVPELRDAAQALLEAAGTAPTPQHALAAFVEDGLLTRFAAAPLRARAEDGLARQSVWPDPLAAHHWRALIAALDAARTPTEVELVAVHAEACLAVEADWNIAFLGSLLLPLRAACTAGMTREGLVLAAQVAHALHGLGGQALLDVPRVAAFLPLLTAEVESAFEGEAGFDVLIEVRGWRDATGELPDPGGALAALDEPAPHPQPVTLWNTAIELVDVAAGLSAPRRPPIPGLAVL